MGSAGAPGTSAPLRGHPRPSLRTPASARSGATTPSADVINREVEEGGIGMENKTPLLLIASLPAFVFPAAYAENVYVYVDPLPPWADYASNVMYLSTEAWKEANPGLEFYQSDNPSSADFTVQWVRDFGGEHVGYALRRSVHRSGFRRQ